MLKCKKNNMYKAEVNKNKCVGCQNCTVNCPVQAIAMVEE